MRETGMSSAAVVVFVEMTKIATAKTTDRHEISVRLFVCIFPLLWIACGSSAWQPACLRDKLVGATAPEVRFAVLATRSLSLRRS